MPSTDPPADRAHAAFAYLLGAGALFPAQWGLFRGAESFKPVFVLVAMAIVLTAVFHGPITFFQRWLPRPLATLIVCLGLAGVGVAAFFLAYPVLVAQVRNLVVLAPIGLAVLIVWQLAVGRAFGLLALLVATPLVAALQVRVESLYVERTLGRPAPPTRAPDAGGA